jgi:hypothetical protein
MSITAAKQHILDTTGFSYNFDRQIYVNHKLKKAFSIEFVSDNDEKTLMERIATKTERWQFNFNVEPSESVKRDLEAVLG